MFSIINSKKWFALFGLLLTLGLVTGCNVSGLKNVDGNTVTKSSVIPAAEIKLAQTYPDVDYRQPEKILTSLITKLDTMTSVRAVTKTDNPNDYSDVSITPTGVYTQTGVNGEQTRMTATGVWVKGSPDFWSKLGMDTVSSTHISNLWVRTGSTPQKFDVNQTMKRLVAELTKNWQSVPNSLVEPTIYDSKPAIQISLPVGTLTAVDDGDGLIPVELKTSQNTTSLSYTSNNVQQPNQITNVHRIIWGCILKDTPVPVSHFGDDLGLTNSDNTDSIDNTGKSTETFSQETNVKPDTAKSSCT